MDYEDKINDIESELKELKTQLESATGEDKSFLNQLIVLLKTRLELFKQLNAGPGNC
jgi:hypothetical protein